MLPSAHLLMLSSVAAAEALLNSVCQGLLLTVCVAALLRLLSGRRGWPAPPAAARSVLWMAVFLIVVWLHFVPRVALPLHDAGAQASSGLRLNPLWAPALVSLWLSLSICRAVQLAFSACRLHRIARRATPVTGEVCCSALLRSGARRAVLCVSPGVDRPSVLGFLSPRILLPPALLAALSASELEQVLLHEMEHLRRGDDWTNLIQKLVLVAFPLHPVLLWIERRLCAERELACDDGVLRRTGAPKAYARCLTHLAEYSLVRRSVSLALGAWERQPELSRRVYRILRQSEAGAAGREARWITALLALLIVAGAGELARTPQFVRFAPLSGSQLPAQVSAQVATPIASEIRASSGSGAGMHRVTLASMPRRSSTALLVRARRVASPRRAASTAVFALANTESTAVFARANTAVEAPDILLTRRPQTPPASVRPVAVLQPIWFSYAAVPVGDGWLIIQL